MKTLLALTLPAVIAAGLATGSPVEGKPGGPKIDDPPPLNCPLCGGDAVRHRENVAFLIELQATALLTILVID